MSTLASAITTTTALCVQAAVAASVTADEAPAQRPNVLMFAVDDLRPQFGKAFGYEEVLTPNLDRFLQEGLVFRNSYVQVAVCGPSRSSVLTGRRPDSTRINAAPPNSWCSLSLTPPPPPPLSLPVCLSV